MSGRSRGSRPSKSEARGSISQALSKFRSFGGGSRRPLVSFGSRDIETLNNVDDVSEFETTKRESFEKNIIKRFNSRLLQTAPHEQKNLRMKLTAGWVFKQAKVDTKGQRLDGQVVLLDCWLDNGKVMYGLMDYRIDPSGKQIQLPQEDEVLFYWGKVPTFYFSTQTNI